MSLVGRGIVALALENVAQMAVTVGTDHLSSGHSQSLVDIELQSARNGLVESRPSTRASELGHGRVQRSVAASTVVGAVVERGIVLAGVGTFGALLAQNTELLWRQNGSPLAIGLVAHVNGRERKVSGGSCGDGGSKFVRVGET